MNELFSSIFSVNFGYAILRVMTPLLFPAMGIAVSTMAGSQNIAMEGAMLIAAFFGVIVGAFSGSLWLALLAGIAAAVLLCMILGYFHLKLKADIFLSAVALNMFSSGITVFLLFMITGDKGSTSSLPSPVFPSIDIPLVEKIPVIGDIISGHNILTYVALVSVFLFYLLMFKTPLGLRIRAVGQNPDAAESVGINVNRTKMYALMLSGLFAALGGLYLSMGYVSWFSKDMTAGRGFIAIAAATLGGMMPLGTMISSLFFALVSAVAIYIASLNIPSELIQLIPYLITVVALAVFSGRALKGRREKIAAEDAGGTESVQEKNNTGDN
ncbi:MAG: ABC transporter permease [Spirochaetales bacterium]|uniref:ABC transporter permease n=1 Tax=Candidatus Thalassospirochaeta sargassi TaxID=3119039 RepID=A0AAJ1IHH8_9SPIO|nr:ABC transporter permease [Spirochaetales bacterium]